MLLLNIDLTTIPLNVLSAAIAFISSYAVVRFQIKHLREDLELLRTANSALRKEMEEKFITVDFKREVLKDALLSKIHTIDKKVTEIHTIIVHKK